MNKDLMKKYESIEKEVQTLTEQLAELSALATEEVSKDVSDVSKETMKQFKKAEQYTKENPWIVAASLSVVGIVVGLFLSKHLTND